MQAFFSVSQSQLRCICFSCSVSLEFCLQISLKFLPFTHDLGKPELIQAIQCHRVAHHLYLAGRRALALALQSRVSELFQVDVHPGAVLGEGILIDHATGVVIGETAVVGDGCTILHHVTLGGSGTTSGKRHPTLGSGVLIGAGATLLGPISVGDGARIGAGSLVLINVPHNRTAVGVPAKILGQQGNKPAAEVMDQTGYISEYEGDYTI